METGMGGVGTLSWPSAEAVLKHCRPAGSPMQAGVLSTCSPDISASVAIIRNHGSLGPMHRLTEEGREAETGGTGAERTVTKCERGVRVNEEHTRHTRVHTVCSCTRETHTHLSSSGTDEHAEGL